MTTEPTPPTSPPDPPVAPAVPVPAPPPRPVPAPVARPTSVLAVVSLVTGITGLVGWVVAPLVFSLAAVICGHLARSEIRAAGPGAMEGDGLALAGLIMGWIMVGLSVLTVLLVIAFFGGLAALLAILGATS